MRVDRDAGCWNDISACTERAPLARRHESTGSLANRHSVNKIPEVAPPPEGIAGSGILFTNRELARHLINASFSTCTVPARCEASSVEKPKRHESTRRLPQSRVFLFRRDDVK